VGTLWRAYRWRTHARQARAAAEAERDRLRDDAENHGAGRQDGVRQRMQYQVQLKRENTALREEVDQLRRVRRVRTGNCHRAPLTPTVWGWQRLGEPAGLLPMGLLSPLRTRPANVTPVV
jgi:hypothetical protein